MLSAVSSLLPNVLQFNHDSTTQKGFDHHNGGETPTAAVHTTEPASIMVDNRQAEQQQEEGVDELGARKKKLPLMNEVTSVCWQPAIFAHRSANSRL